MNILRIKRTEVPRETWTYTRRSVDRMGRLFSRIDTEDVVIGQAFINMCLWLELDHEELAKLDELPEELHNLGVSTAEVDYQGLGYDEIGQEGLTLYDLWLEAQTTIQRIMPYEIDDWTITQQGDYLKVDYTPRDPRIGDTVTVIPPTHKLVFHSRDKTETPYETLTHFWPEPMEDRPSLRVLDDNGDLKELHIFDERWSAQAQTHEFEDKNGYREHDRNSILPDTVCPKTGYVFDWKRWSPDGSRIQTKPKNPWIIVSVYDYEEIVPEDFLA